MSLRSHFRQGEVEATEVMPSSIFGEMIDSLLQKSAGIGSFVQKQTSHAAIEKNRNVFFLRLPRSQSFLSSAAMPGECGLLVCPSRPPFWRHVGYTGDQLARLIKLLGETKSGDCQQASGEFIAARGFAGPLNQLRRFERPRIRICRRFQL